ncbi:UMP kinase [Patescibacteria group bacterium]|nr:UMP kinase [Patescibacteria group bacterium]
MFGFDDKKSPITVISLGGSMVAPELPNGVLVKAFVDQITARTKEGRRFVIVVGGGRTARNYYEALKAAGNQKPEDGDWIGIYATHLNAELVRLTFGEIAHPDVNKDPTKKMDWKTPVLIAGGWVPGRSTDYDAVLLSKMYGATKMVNISNIDYVYTADPKKDPNAKPIEKISWIQLRAMLPHEWSPSISAPFDPIAAKEAEALKISVSIVNGADLENALSAIDGKEFKGTSIQN